MKKLHPIIAAIILPLTALIFMLTLLAAGPVRAAPPARPLLVECIVTNPSDSGPGSLRECMENASSGDIISFDPAVFPPANPTTITLTSKLPPIITDNLTIDGSNAGVILFGNRPGPPDGIVIDGASGVVIKGLQIINFLTYGIIIQNGATNNTIGGASNSPAGPCSGDCNLINGIGGGMGNSAILIRDDGTASNTVSGNYIGTDINGTSAVPNQHGIFIWLGAQSNVITGNLISGNRDGGIAITNNGTMSNTVRGNYIGTDVAGTAAIPNGGPGVVIALSASYSTVDGNIVSGNDDDGIILRDTGTVNNTISGNYIGTDATGTSKLGNAGFGILIVNGAAENTIGGSSSGGRNLISGNIDGIYIGDSGTMSNTIKGNYIGTDVTGTADLGNDDVGIAIEEEAAYNVIGGDNASPGGLCSGDCNLISGNGEWGIFLSDTSPHYNTVSGNYIGTNVSGTAGLANADGIIMRDGAHHNLIGGETPARRNLISGNSRDGIRVAGSTSLYNTLQQNAIYNNDGRGIELMDGGNTELPTPVINDCDLNLGTAGGTACPLCKIEIFSDDEDEGQYYEGPTTADAGGNWTFDKGGPFLASYCTATATDAEGNTSEFSEPAPPLYSSVYLPILLKGAK